MSLITLSRRNLLKSATAAAAVSALPMPYVRTAAAATEIVHWSPLAASDGEVWGQMIANFNDAHKDKGVQIKMEVVPWDDYTTKVLAAAAAGSAPDFGWNTDPRPAFVRDGLLVPLDDLAKASGLNVADFSDFSIAKSKFPKYGGDALYQIPMDLMSLQPEVNTAHVSEAGLKIDDWPDDGDKLIEWAKAMTKMDGGKVVRSGIMMTGSGVQPTVTWGIVSEQMGFKRISDDGKSVAVNPDAGKAAMQWILDLFDKHKVSTRDVTDRYKAFGSGQGSIFWTGPWTLNGYIQQKLPLVTKKFPKIGANRVTYFERGALELYTQKDTSRHQATMDAVTWLSDNSFLWTTAGRGASPRKSIISRADYKTAGAPWEVRGAFVDGMEYATAIADYPIINGADFNIYSGGNFLAKTLELVWAGKSSIDDAMAKLQEGWQKALDEG
ncbi:MAG: extracellular solute-binding protein [Rhizobiales bacterium]|nr:extracellular solute-binding protein [Hyphomicrobiales bacterium]